MRLTLRTLLAYLDNTLDPQDAEALRQKLTESGFATQLVQRIRDSLDASLPAPPAEAVGPVEDANLISEYLDSTLTAEQVAEIERACLESGPQLAEAAACHQILTMALGESAEVPIDLRDRIYNLPQQEELANGTPVSFSGISLPSDQPSLLDIPTEDISTPAAAVVLDSEPVPPVGLQDSGVIDAPTRLRQAEATAAANQTHPKNALAGSKPRNLDDSMVYGGTFRPSRIAPWLISLALVAALGFAIVRIFEPLWNPQQVAEQTNSDESTGENPADGNPIDGDAAGGANGDAAGGDAAGGDAGAKPASEGQETGDPGMTTEVEPIDMAPPLPPTAPSESEDPNAVTADNETPTTSPDPATEANSSVPADDAENPASPSTNANNEPETPMTEEAVDSTPPPVPPPAEVPSDDDAAPTAIDVATLKTESTLVAAKSGEAWKHLKKEDVISTGMPLLVAPSFRAELVTSDAILAILGPAKAEWDGVDPNQPVLQFDIGNLIIKSTSINKLLHLRLETQPVVIRLAHDQTILAVSVQHDRAAGLDPLEVNNRRTLLNIQTLQGEAEITYENVPAALNAGQQWSKQGSNEPQITDSETEPQWLDPENDDPLLQAARDGLLGLIEDAQPLEIELREARLFRRLEVGALAAETLLNMGYGDVYFGGDGVLSDPKQRPYWSDHFSALEMTINQSVDSAMNLRNAMIQMDSANAAPLFRLLTGFSQKQLVEGGDEELVKRLDSPSMSVRVLALENLKAITGSTSNFRPDQENAIRRNPGIKTWIARQRKGDIRWQE
ncbi:MAG: hypothetical protein P8L85_24915 [Rubripirellula sp.]|nr:hypothetical protein [Rubripirellula sp.]